MQEKKEQIIIGDKLPNGTFNLHSSFKKVLNYYNPNDLISFVLPNVGATAVSIVVPKFPENIPQTIVIDNKNIFFGNSIIPKNNCITYKSTPEKIFIPQNILELISTSQSEIKKSGLSFLINKNTYFKESFFKNFADKMQQGVDIFFKNPLIGAEKIKGLGFGLTPAGDDFLCGAISALWIKNKIGNLNKEDLINNIYQASISNNLLSNSFLKQSKNGNFFFEFKEVVENLNNPFIFKTKAVALATIGDSSGSAMLLGLLLTLKDFDLQK